jgi:hypothetical protein
MSLTRYALIRVSTRTTAYSSEVYLTALLSVTHRTVADTARTNVMR